MPKTGMVYLRPVPVVFHRAQGPYATSTLEAWDRMLSWLDSHGLRQSTPRGYGLARDNPRIVGADKCRYDACIELPSDLDPKVLDGMMTQRLPGGAYARRRHVGDYARMRDLIVEMRDECMPKQGLVIDEKRPLVTIFLNDPKHFDLANLKVDVCLPVAASADRSAA